MMSRLCQKSMREPTIWQEKSPNAGYEVRGCASRKERKSKKRGGRGETTSFLVCILITSFCRKLLGIRDTQPRLGFSARTHPRVPASERERERGGRNSFPYTPSRRERWSVGRECRSEEGEEDGGDKGHEAAEWLS